jgi:hypothetical protein
MTAPLYRGKGTPTAGPSPTTAKNGALPAAIVWSGNVLLALWGEWLLKRVIRY